MGCLSSAFSPAVVDQALLHRGSVTVFANSDAPECGHGRGGGTYNQLRNVLHLTFSVDNMGAVASHCYRSSRELPTRLLLMTRLHTARSRGRTYQQYRVGDSLPLAEPCHSVFALLFIVSLSTDFSRMVIEQGKLYRGYCYCFRQLGCTRVRRWTWWRYS